jgi:hypothetical protein
MTDFLMEFLAAPWWFYAGMLAIGAIWGLTIALICPPHRHDSWN